MRTSKAAKVILKKNGIPFIAFLRSNRARSILVVVGYGKG